MMLAFVLATAAAAVVQPTDQQRFDTCTRLIATDAAKALDDAAAWRLAGGGIAARQCEGLAYVALHRWAPATTVFESAARDADAHADGRATNLWVQAGNAALAGGDPARARTAFDAAIIRGQAGGADLGKLYLDRARARVATLDLPGGRADIDAALKLVPADPLAWLLSATLARAMNDLPRATTDIAQAAQRSPDDAQVALEAGNIAMASGADDAARSAWEAAIRNAPASPAAGAAREALARLGKTK